MVDPDLNQPLRSTADEQATSEAATNQAQREFWTGASGARWVGRRDRFDDMLHPFLEQVLIAAAIVAGERLLDVGCGPGALSRAAALADADALGIDISPTMIAAANDIPVQGVRFEVLDAQTAVLEPADIVASRFGVMFFDDPVAAFANLASTGGRLAFVCWRAAAVNPWVVEPTAAILDVIGALPEVDPLAPGPFAFADRDRVAGILGEAGWADVRIDPFDTAILLGGPGTTDDAADFATHVGPAARLLEGEPDDVVAEVRRAMLQRFAPHHDGDGVRFGAATWIVTGRPG